MQKERAKCSIDGCDRPVKTRGWCALHYQRWYHHGDPKADVPVNGVARRWADDLVRAVPPTDQCIRWPFGFMPNGYPHFSRDGADVRAHRWVCEQVHGEPPSHDHQAAHHCGHRWCVNPRHIRWATIEENMADKLIHGTDSRGAKNANAKLSADDVRQIRTRLAEGERQGAIAEAFDVSQACISLIKHGPNWSHLA